MKRNIKIEKQYDLTKYIHTKMERFENNEWIEVVIYKCPKCTELIQAPLNFKGHLEMHEIEVQSSLEAFC